MENMGRTPDCDPLQALSGQTLRAGWGFGFLAVSVVNRASQWPLIPILCILPGTFIDSYKLVHASWAQSF
jgi:hypothetical protein